MQGEKKGLRQIANQGCYKAQLQQTKQKRTKIGMELKLRTKSSVFFSPYLSEVMVKFTFFIYFADLEKTKIDNLFPLSISAA